MHIFVCIVYYYVAELNTAHGTVVELINLNIVFLILAYI